MDAEPAYETDISLWPRLFALAAVVLELPVDQAPICSGCT